MPRTVYKDVAVKYVNATGNVDFEVVVNTDNQTPHSENRRHIAWQVLKAQTTSQFVYPIASSVAASYRASGQYITCGPFPADPGSTWHILQEFDDVTAVLKEVKDSKAPENPDGSIIIRNVPPLAWTGRMFDCHVYKDNHAIITHFDVHTGDQVCFLIKPILTFRIARNIHVGQSFDSREVSSDPYKVDLSKFINGLKITLHQETGGGRYYFSSEKLT